MGFMDKIKQEIEERNELPDQLVHDCLNAESPADLLRWTLQRWPELQTGDPIEPADLLVWFSGTFAPRARAILGSPEPTFRVERTGDGTSG